MVSWLPYKKHSTVPFFTAAFPSASQRLSGEKSVFNVLLGDLGVLALLYLFSCQLKTANSSYISTTCWYSGTMTLATGFICFSVSAWARHWDSSPWMQVMSLMSPEIFST